MESEAIGNINYSWIDTYNFYLMYHYRIASEGKSRGNQIEYYLRIIVDLVKAGYISEFRIGTSLFSLILSRSIDNHLRVDQKRIKICIEKENIYLVHNLEGKFLKENIDYNGIESIRGYLEILKSNPFD